MRRNAPALARRRDARHALASGSHAAMPLPAAPKAVSAVAPESHVQRHETVARVPNRPTQQLPANLRALPHTAACLAIAGPDATCTA